METERATLAGFRGMRAALLIALKKGQPMATKELARQFGLTANALRRHLKELEEHGLVQYRREIRGVGGPVFAYSLTAKGEELFPRDYAPALIEVLEAVREQLGPEGVVAIFRRRWEAVVAGAQEELAALPLGERAGRLAELLTSSGYMAEAEMRSETEGTIREHNCAIRAIVARFPEVCAAEAEFIQSVLGAAVERQQHIASGCNACEYVVQLQPRRQYEQATTKA